jgi:hypothetical protein
VISCGLTTDMQTSIQTPQSSMTGRPVAVAGASRAKDIKLGGTIAHVALNASQGRYIWYLVDLAGLEYVSASV